MEHRLSATLELKDRFTTTLRAATSQLHTFSKNAERIKGGLTNVTRSMERMAIGGSIMGVGVVAGLKSSFMAFADLEDQVKRNKAIMGASAAQEAALMEQTKNLGRSTRFTAQEVAQAQMYQAMAGLKTNEVLELTPKLLKLSIASGEDLARTSDIVTDNLSAFGLELKDVDRLMDVMAATANNSNTSISMLGEAYQYVAATSKSFDSMEEVTTMLGILADNSIKGAKAGRNLAGIYARLSKITPDMREQLEKTGTKLYDVNGKFKGLRTVITESKEALSKLSEEQRNNWLATIAGTEGLKIWNSIMNNSVEGTRKVENAVKNSKGSMDKFADEMATTNKNKMAEFKSAIEGVKIAIGEGLAPVATEFMNNWIQKINEATDAGLFDTTNLENYFRTAESWAKKAVIFYGLVKAAAFAATHPYIAGAAAAGAAGYYLGDKLVDHFALEGRATEIYTKHGGSMSMDEAREEAKRVMQYEARTANYTPEQRAAEVKKGYDIMENAKKNNRRKELEEYINKYGANNYMGLRYSDIEKNITNTKNINNSINNIKNNQTEQKNITNTKNINNTKEQPDSKNFNFTLPEINVNLGSVTINDEKKIKEISSQVGRETDEALAAALMTQFITQK